MLIFVEGGKPENPEKNPRSKDENQQQTEPTYDTGTEPGSHWWDASALTTAPSLLPRSRDKCFKWLRLKLVLLHNYTRKQTNKIHDWAQKKSIMS